MTDDSITTIVECEGCPSILNEVKPYTVTEVLEDGSCTTFKVNYCNSCAHLVRCGWLPNYINIREAY